MTTLKVKRTFKKASNGNGSVIRCTVLSHAGRKLEILSPSFGFQPDKCSSWKEREGIYGYINTVDLGIVNNNLDRKLLLKLFPFGIDGGDGVYLHANVGIDDLDNVVSITALYDEYAQDLQEEEEYYEQREGKMRYE